MSPESFVLLPPPFDDHLRLLKSIENLPVEHLIPQSSIEGFVLSILPRAAWLDALEQALSKRGLPRKLYLENSPVFRSEHLEHITASLGIALLHSSPYNPQGRGKTEGFFRTLRSQFLPGFTGHTLHELDQAVDLWANDI